MGEDTTLRVSHETWKRLHARKEPGDSMNDVVVDLLDRVDAPSDGKQPADA